MIFVVSAAFGQKSQPGLPIKSLANGQHNCYSSIKFNKYYRLQIEGPGNADHSKPFVKFLPGNYYADHLGFFCKQEIKMEKITRVPFKFRLGSLQQCDWLEGKRY